MRSPVTSAEVRQAVLDLGAEAFRDRLEALDRLPIEFIKKARLQPRVLAVADSTGRQLSFGNLAATSGVFARSLAKVLTPEENVGLLLPASVGGALANISLSLLGRVPVNLNYTTGPQALEAAIQKARITRILTSRKLLEKTGIAPASSMVYLEDLIPTLAKGEVAWERLLISVLPEAWILRRYRALAAPKDASPVGLLERTATILFSSGSMGQPKGVVLSHANILSNILGLAQVFDVGKNDRMIGVLPFFHSFGFTATLWFPLITGFSALYHSNPLDGKMVGELSAKYRATLLLSTPTFLLAYVRKCTPEQFAGMRYVITGAERLRESVAKAFEDKFGKTILEGYGCTELSPVATVNVPNVSMGEINQVGHKNGMIGRPIPGVSVKIVDQATFQALPQGQRGLLLVKGLNVMKGYLGEPEMTHEVLREGWYVTGDVAVIDGDGFVQIVDRLTRFAKIGGEMVPHVLIEEKLQQLSGLTEPAFIVSSVPDEKRGEQLVVLYVAGSCKPEELYQKLQDSDLPKLWIPPRENFFDIPAIPILGTGKLDLAAIKTLAQDKKKPS